MTLTQQDSTPDEIAVLKDPTPEGLRLHMCVVFAPWMEEAFEKPEEGVFCACCCYTLEQDRLYTNDSFNEHLRDCHVRPSVTQSIERRDAKLTVAG